MCGRKRHRLRERVPALVWRRPNGGRFKLGRGTRAPLAFSCLRSCLNGNSNIQVDHGARSHPAKNEELPLQVEEEVYGMVMGGSSWHTFLPHQGSGTPNAPDVNNELQRLRELLNATAQEKERRVC